MTLLRALLVASVAATTCARPRVSLCSRRAAICTGVLAVAPLSASADTSSATVTDRVRLEFVQQISAEEQRLFVVNVGLFGADAPNAAEAFKQLAAGTLNVPCKEMPDDPEVMQRSELARKAAYKTCEGAAATPVGYGYSQVWRILSGRRVDAGAVQGKFALRQAPKTPIQEAAGLLHDRAGLLSVRRGGGTFDFGLTASATPEYDDDFCVIGRVLDDESLQAVSLLAGLPVVKAAEAFGQGDGGTASREKACACATPLARNPRASVLRELHASQRTAVDMLLRVGTLLAQMVRPIRTAARTSRSKR